MAAQYDALGNYLGDWETEEERRKREEEYANTAIKTQEVKTYGDGTVERTTKEEMAPAIQQPRVRPVQQTAVAQPVAPISPEDYNRMIQRQESGNRPNIGFHNQQLSSAYGPYGTTAAGWADARRVNPSLPQDITQATPEQLTAGQNAYTQQNAKYLQAYGVEPTQNNLAAAHFLGAKGLADYLQTGAISPQAAAANGGEENVRRIVNARLGGQAAPASGAAQPSAPVSPTELTAQQPTEPSQYSLATGQTGMGLKAPGGAPAQVDSSQWINQYQQVQDDPAKLLALRNDENASTFIRERAGDRAYELMNMEVQKKQAQEQAKTLAAAAAAGDRRAGNTIAKELQNQDGSWLKMILLGFISPQLAGEEAIKLGFGNKWVQGQDAEGKSALIQVNAKGLPLKGYTTDGKEIASNDLVSYATGGAKVTTSGTFFQSPTGQILRAQSDEQGRTRLVDAASGARYTGPTTGLTKLEEAGALRKMDRGLVIDLAKKHGQNVLDAEKEYVSLNGPFKSPEERQQFRQAYGYDLAQPAAVPGVAGFPGAPAGQAPQAAPAMAQPGAGRVPTMAQPGQAPAVPAQGMGGVQRPISEMQTGVAINKEQQQQFVKYAAEDITPKADAGGQVARIRKEQIKGPDGILNNPEIAGLLQGGSGSEVGNIIRDLVTGNFKDQADLSTRVASLNLTDRQKDVLYRQINLATQVNPQTLKANAGAGAVSDAEQKANRQANIDITRQPLYAGLADMARSQFVNDMAVARADFKAARPDIKTTEQFNSEWSKEKSRRQKEYDQIFEARAAYIAKYNKDGKNPGAVVDAFKYYPTPEWNSETRSWDLGTDYAKKAARPKLTEFIR